MSVKFFYLVKGTLYRTKNSDENLIEVNEIFRHDNPIVARQNAFRFYQNYIDVFLQSKGAKYVSYEETVRLLRDFVKSDKKQYFKLGGEIIDTIDADFDKGLSIFLVMDNSRMHTTLEGEAYYEDKHLIHYLSNGLTDYLDSAPAIVRSLIYEHQLYQEMGYDMDGQSHSIEYVSSKNKTLNAEILYSPFNLEGLTIVQFLRDVLKH